MGSKCCVNVLLTRVVDFRTICFEVLCDYCWHCVCVIQKKRFQKSVWKICKIEDVCSVHIVLCMLFGLGFC